MRCRLGGLLIRGVVLAGALAGPALGAAAPKSFTFGGSGFTLRAPSADYNFDTGNFTIPRRFTATTSDGTDIAADRATGNQKKKLLDADGHVIVHQNKGQQISTLTTNSLHVDGVKKTYIAIGNVHYVEGARDIVADRGTLDEVSNLLHLEGSVHIKDGDNDILADRVVYNTITGEAHAENVTARGPVPNPPASATASPSPKSKHR